MASEVRSIDAKRKEEYAAYRQSVRWKRLREAVKMRAKGKCEVCLRRDGVECAHLTYDRIFRERMEDLIWVCGCCHYQLDMAVPTS